MTIEVDGEIVILRMLNDSATEQVKTFTWDDLIAFNRLISEELIKAMLE